MIGPPLVLWFCPSDTRVTVVGEICGEGFGPRRVFLIEMKRSAVAPGPEGSASALPGTAKQCPPFGEQIPVQKRPK